jgi:hypothetical protein
MTPAQEGLAVTIEEYIYVIYSCKKGVQIFELEQPVRV